MHLVIVGVNHKTAPVEMREKLAVDEGKLGSALTRLRSRGHISEACILSTCNRTEVYAVTHTRADDETLVSFLADYGGVGREELADCVYRRPGHHAVKHLFEVACGLDSMAIGETQVLGQVRDAYCIASDTASTGAVLDNLFQRAIAVGKRARTETEISRGAFSIGAAAVALAKFVFGDLKGRKALLLGAGEMSKLAATHLQANGVDKVYIASRTPAKVEKLVSELGGEAISMRHFEEALREVDVVISSTSSRRPVITRQLMERVLPLRACAPIFLIDIAVPRDIEPEVAGLDGVFLYNIDDLQFLVDRCKAEREAEVERVRAIIDEEVESYMAYLRTLEAVPLIKQLRDKFDSVHDSELERCLSRLGHLSEQDQEVVRKAIKSVVNKLTHDPVLRIKEYAANGGSSKLDIVRELFGLDTEPRRVGESEG